jgi:ATP-binding cassette subfamily D (ALD) long-chain fatty acid import protein
MDFSFFTECTSAVSSDVEGWMYEHAKSLGITLITISIRSVTCKLSHRTHHPLTLVNDRRPSLAKYHTALLTVTGDGSGGWTLSRVGTAEERMSVDREIATLEGKLAEVEEWDRRVQELDKLLSATSSD